jgi:hypothetical protein
MEKRKARSMSRHMKEPGPKGTSEHEGKVWGQGEFANMPKDVMMHPYPVIYPKDEGIDDTISRLDEDSNDARFRKKKDMDKGMY